MYCVSLAPVATNTFFMDGLEIIKKVKGKLEDSRVDKERQDKEKKEKDKEAKKLRDQERKERKERQQGEQAFMSSNQDVNFIVGKLGQMGKGVFTIDVIGDYHYKVLDSDGKVWNLDYSNNH